MSNIAILIPCYNESQTIAKVINDYKKVLPEAKIYVYDNNSTDGTDLIAKKQGGNVIVRYEHRQGKGNVIRTMFREINADCYLIVDGDDTYPADIAKEMCNMVLEKSIDMVIGDRLTSTYFEENKRLFHNFGNIVVRKLINSFWKPEIKITDIMTGYRAFSPIFVKTFPILSKGFEIETEMTIHALDKNLLIQQIPVKYRDRPQGSESKLNTYTDGIKVLFTIFNLYRLYNPIKFFTFISLIMLIFGLGLGIPVLTDYMHTGLVPRVPTLIVSSIMLLSSFLANLCGIILDANIQNNRKNFEISMNIIKLLIK